MDIDEYYERYGPKGPPQPITREDLRIFFTSAGLIVLLVCGAFMLYFLLLYLRSLAHE